MGALRVCNPTPLYRNQLHYSINACPPFVPTAKGEASGGCGGPTQVQGEGQELGVRHEEAGVRDDEEAKEAGRRQVMAETINKLVIKYSTGNA